MSKLDVKPLTKSKPVVKPVKKSKALIVTATKPLKPMDRHEMISKEAYLLAEKRGFHGGDSVADWLKAEAKIDRNQE
jgi:hypothetical protein